MAKIENRYLNLMGAPWTPDKPKSSITLTNYFAAAATSLAIFGAAQINPNTQQQAPVHLLEGIVGAAIAVGLMRRTRKEEAERLSSRFETLVIDTKPDQSTPPTSQDILSRTHALCTEYKHNGSFLSRSLRGALVDTLLGASDMQYLLTAADRPLHVPALFMPYFVVHASDIVMRYRQLKNIESGKWVITDQGDAVQNFQDLKREVFANGNVPVPVPAGLDHS